MKEADDGKIFVVDLAGSENAADAQVAFQPLAASVRSPRCNILCLASKVSGASSAATAVLVALVVANYAGLGASIEPPR